MKLGTTDYMKTMEALSTKNCDIQYASADMKRFAELAIESLIAERNEARRIAEECISCLKHFMPHLTCVEVPWKEEK